MHLSLLFMNRPSSHSPSLGAFPSTFCSSSAIPHLPASQQPRMLMTRRCLTARFGLLGALVGKFPWASAGLFLLVISTPALLGLWLGLRLEIGLDDGFVPWNAPSRREITAQKQFFGNTEQTKEWYMALFGIARPADGGGGRNMLMSENYDEFAAFYERITRRMVFQGPRGNFTYADICQPLCDINDSLQKLMEHSWLKYLGQVKMRYPVSRVLSYDVNIGKHVFNRTLDANGELVGAESVAFYFTAFIRDGMRAKELEQFELAVATEAAAHNLRPNSRVELIAHGSNSVRTEMSSGIMDAFRNRLLGLAFGLLAFLALHAAAGWLHSQFPWRRLLLAMLCVPFLPLAFFSSLSLLSLIGLSVNLLHFTSPLLAIGLLFVVYGSFQLADAWCRLFSESKRKQFTASERLASTFEQIAPAFLSSQLGPALAFGILSPLLPAFHYRSFCLALSLMHGFCFLLQVLFFAPLLARLCHHHSDHVRFVNGQPTVLEFGPNDPVMATKKPSIADHPPIIQLKAKNGHDLIPAATNGHLQMAKRREQRKAAKRQLRLAVSQKLIRPWSAFLRSLVGRILITFVTTILLWLALGQGMPALKNDMDYRRLLPEGSPAHRGFHLIDSIWMDFLQILYIVHKPPDFEQPEQFNEFKNFLVAATALPQALPPEAHMSWLVDYYRDRLHSELFDRLSPDYASEAVNMSHFGEFINGFPYRAWQSGVRFSFRPENNLSRPSIDQMLVIIAYNETRGLAGKRRLINQCRQVAKQFAQFRVTVFDTDLRTTDIMDTVEPMLWRTAAALVLSAFLVCLLFLWQFSAAFLAALTAASTLAMLFGLGQLLGLQLDLLTVPTAIVVASLSIQLGAQLLGHLLSCWAKEDPHWHAMALSVSALTKTLLVWLVLSLPPLLLSRVPFFGLQARLLLLGALLALWHGLALVPMLAGLLPRGWLI